MAPDCPVTPSGGANRRDRRGRKRKVRGWMLCMTSVDAARRVGVSSAHWTARQGHWEHGEALLRSDLSRDVR